MNAFKIRSTFSVFDRFQVLVVFAALALAARVRAAERWDWTERPPKVVWQAEIGAGFSSVALQDALVFAFGNVSDEDRVTALEAATGRIVWQYRYPCRALGIAEPDERGPRATPLAHAGAVYTLSRDGRILCLNASDGTLRWWKDIPGELGEKPPYWGFAGSPLVWGDLLIWSVGDHGLAVRASSGEVVWKSPPRAPAVWKDEPVGTSGYTTPQPTSFGGRKLISLANESQWVVVDPDNGKPVWSAPFEVPYGVTAVQPVLLGDRVILSGGYGFGICMYQLGGEPKPIWANKNLRSHFANLAVVGEHLYGISGNQQDGARCELRCLRLSDGGVAWAKERFGFGNLTLVEGRLLVITAGGELVLVLPDPSGYREAGRVQVMSGDCWTAPLVSGNRVFVRSKQGTLVRVDLP